MKRNDNQALAHCRSLMEQKLGLGLSEGWTTQDFERVSEQIHQQTGVVLSVSTLKRIWGRVKYDSLPTVNTLNVLARFIGYATWLDFERAQRVEPLVEEPAAVPVLPAPALQRNKLLSRWLPAAIVLLIVITISAFIIKSQTVATFSPDAFSFNSQTVTRDIPNSVIFRYNATAADPRDSIFIQQSWDATKRQMVPRTGREHMSIYYYPGYFRAKLLVGNQVVKEHDLYIPSDGWVVAVKQEPVPVYFNKEQTVQKGTLHLSEITLQEKNIPLQPQPPKVRYRNVPDMKGLRNDNFIFETRVRNHFVQGAAACQKASIVLLCQDNIFLIPLSEALFMAAPAEIVGVSYEFDGPGAVDFTRFRRLDRSLVFEDTFD
jgi:hypothetical protein